MSNFHLEIRIISRGNESSVVQIANYISGVKLYDTYFNKTYYSKRNDVLFLQIFLPDNVPPKFNHLQKLCNEIDSAEKRYDAQTARQFIGSLPNELPFGEQKQIVVEYINHNFVASGLCAIAAIHEGKNEFDPKKNNPHVHILVSTRRIEPDGFNKIKDREHNKKNILESGESNGHKSRIVPTSETVMIYGSVMKALKSRASAANQLYTLAVLIGKGKCGVSPPLQETKNVLLGNVIWNMPGNIK